MEVDAFEYFQDAVRVFRCSHPTIGSEVLARQLLDYCLLRICGLLEQKIKNMYWYARGEDVTLYELEIPHTELIEEKTINEILKLYYKIRDHKEFTLDKIRDAPDLNSIGENIVNVMKQEMEVSVRDILYVNIYRFIMPLNSIQNLSGSIRGRTGDSFVKGTLIEAKKYRNKVAHNGASIYERSPIFEELREQRNSVFSYIGILLYLDKILTKLFKDYRQKEEIDNFCFVP